jgi:isoleucyl-tRNA synthetase
MVVVLPKWVKEESLADVVDVISEEINIKNIRFTTDNTEIIGLKAKPNFKLLGPKLGKMIKTAKAAIEALPDSELRDYVKNGQLTLKLDGEQFIISGEELEIESVEKENFAVESENGYEVAISTLLSDELVMEGYARELVNKIQNMRKSADFQVTDRISVAIQATDDLRKALDDFGDYIKAETLADRIDLGEYKGEFTQEWDINGQPAKITVSRI